VILLKEIDRPLAMDVEINRCFEDFFQREKKPRDVLRIADEWTWALFGVLIVSEREDGRYSIIDGGHRWQAADKLGTETTLPALVYRGLTIEQEAELFVLLQQRRKALTALQRFRAQLVYDPEAQEVERIVKAYGYEIGPTGGSNEGPNIGAVRSLERVYEAPAPISLDQTLALNRRVWNGDPDAKHGEWIEGLARFEAAYSDRITDEICTKLAKHAPVTYRRRAVKDSEKPGYSRGVLPEEIYKQIRKESGLRGAPHAFTPRKRRRRA
jgi:hypothetical protein